jgi:hypothetical protein
MVNRLASVLAASVAGIWCSLGSADISGGAETWSLNSSQYQAWPYAVTQSDDDCNIWESYGAGAAVEINYATEDSEFGIGGVPCEAGEKKFTVFELNGDVPFLPPAVSFCMFAGYFKDPHGEGQVENVLLNMTCLS